MIPVYQTRTVANDGAGNCFAACVASILELPLREVCGVLPNQSDTFWSDWETWLDDRGLVLNTHFEAPKGYALASGYGGRFYPDDHKLAGRQIMHAVVVFNGELIHDPYPGGKGVRDVKHYQTLDLLSEEEQIAA